MPYHAIINDFMMAKAERIDAEKVSKHLRGYYTTTDSASIRKMERDEARRVVEELVKGLDYTLKNFGKVNVLSHRVCPFCITNEFTGSIDDIYLCDGCEYAKTHGYCHDPESDLVRIQRGEILWEPIYEIFDRNFFHEQFTRLNRSLEKINGSSKTK